LHVLAQHLVTVALGGAFRENEMLAQVRGTHAFATLTDEEWQWGITFITRRGVLQSYPQVPKGIVYEHGVYRLIYERLARLHRITIGTIVADGSVFFGLKSGKRMRYVEEGFIQVINPGKCFIFGVRCWELVRMHGLVATVCVPTKRQARGEIPSWQGGK